MAIKIKRKRGDTYPDRFVISSQETGSVVDITGYSFLMTVDSNQVPVDETTKQYQLVGDIEDAVNGVVSFTPSVAQADLVGTFYFDCQLTDTGGRIRTFESGTYIYEQDITK